MNDTTRERVKEILAAYCTGNRAAAVDLLHVEFVLIPREEIPFSEVEGESIKIPGSPSWSLAGQSYAKLFREACRLISRAQAVARHEYEQKIQAQRKLEAELEAEAIDMCNKVVGLPFDEKAPAMNMEHWTKVAIAAREVYGVTK